MQNMLSFALNRLPKLLIGLKLNDIPFKVLDSFLYPSHSSYRMHAVPETTGAALIQRLLNAANHREILIS